jgi:hypothetical protein
MTKSRNFLRCGILATMTLLYGACNSDEVPQESNSNSASNTETDSNSNTNTESNSDTPGTVSDSESNSNTVPTEGTATDSDSNDTSDSTPSTPSQASAEDSDSTPTDGNTDSSTESAGSDTEGDTDSDSDTNGNMCVAPPADDECETCLFDNCKDEYCACAADEKCLCVMNCLDGITGGDSNGLDDLLGLDLDDLLGGLLDGVLGDLFDDLTDQDFDDLQGVLECLTNDPCGVPLDIDLEDLLDGTELNPEDILDLENLLELDDLDDILENILEVAGNSLAPLTTCSELTNPNGECGTICPLEESILDD